MAAEEIDVLRIVVQRLDSAKIEYMVSGSIAANFYAQPRMTRDIDIVVHISKLKIGAFYDLFKDDFYIDRDSISEAVNNGGIFNIIHNDKVMKIDFIVAKDTDYEKEKFERRVTKEVDGTRLSIASPEDLILSKLSWAKGSHSQMQLNDVRNIISFNKDILDWNYLRSRAVRLSIKDLLEECINA